ncbi:hypothetical protein PR048_023942 [Dryococelus australis]|uniref:Uncharacterized protein n=1 Tax=Dryococelus australis TaxID=614101 RepID=A0ABQ9GVH1_9NEOP|nr:hypothetical protein PR048_023942 [Dryococelus australis]
MLLLGGFSRGAPVSPALPFLRCSILSTVTLIGSRFMLQSLAVDVLQAFPFLTRDSNPEPPVPQIGGAPPDCATGGRFLRLMGKVSEGMWEKENEGIGEKEYKSRYSSIAADCSGGLSFPGGFYISAPGGCCRISFSTGICSLHLFSAGIKRKGKREIPEKTRRPMASSGRIPTCENPGVIRPGWNLVCLGKCVVDLLASVAWPRRPAADTIVWSSGRDQPGVIDWRRKPRDVAFASPQGGRIGGEIKIFKWRGGSAAADEIIGEGAGRPPSLPRDRADCIKSIPDARHPARGHLSSCQKQDRPTTSSPPSRVLPQKKNYMQGATIRIFHVQHVSGYGTRGLNGVICERTFCAALIYAQTGRVAERLDCSPPTKAVPSSIPGRVTPGFSQVGIVSDDTAVRRELSRGSPESPALATPDATQSSPHFARIGSHDLVVEKPPKCLQLNSNIQTAVACKGGGKGSALGKTSPVLFPPPVSLQARPFHLPSRLASSSNTALPIPDNVESHVENSETISFCYWFFAGFSPRVWLPATKLLPRAHQVGKAQSVKISRLYDEVPVYPAPFYAFEAEERGSDKGDIAVDIKFAIAAKNKALHWRAVFSSHCVYLWGFQPRMSAQEVRAGGQVGPVEATAVPTACEELPSRPRDSRWYLVRDDPACPGLLITPGFPTTPAGTCA